MSGPPPANKRKQGPRGHHPYRSRPSSMTTTGPTQQQRQPRRPTTDAPQETHTPQVMDVRRLYSTANGAPDAKPFSSLGFLDKSLLAGLDKMGFELMSPVQQKVLTELPSLSSDCLVQAKTGTGKTVAFLLPPLQNLLAGNRPSRGKVALLIICPTRELAIQIKDEFDSITACLSPKIECHTAFGGTSRASSLRRFLEGNPTVLVATPGRLDDILGEEAVRDKFDELKTVVLDEADRMLDQGFAPAIFKILKRLPPKSAGWQGMCFSATLPPNVSDVVKCVLFPGYISLSTIDKSETPTVDRVPQFLISVPSAVDVFPALHALIEAEHKQAPQDFKVVVFGTTANGVGLLFDLFKVALPQFKVFELHSRLSQNARTRTTEEFKNATSGILFASDVVGRGMDFPNVGLVIQAGLPSSAEQYVHRVGRTARAGKDGRAVTILFDNESFFFKTNPSLPVKPYPVPIASQLEPSRALLEDCFARIDEVTKSKAYQAFLGYNKTYLKKLRLDTKSLVQIANEYAKAMGCPEPPMIDKRVVGKMGLKGVPGLRIGTIQAQNGQ